jgi:hypothetical protein
MLAGLEDIPSLLITLFCISRAILTFSHHQFNLAKSVFQSTFENKNKSFFCPRQTKQSKERASKWNIQNKIRDKYILGPMKIETFPYGKGEHR